MKTCKCSSLLYFVAVVAFLIANARAESVETAIFNASNLVATFELTDSILVPTPSPQAGTSPPAGPNPNACPTRIRHVEYERLAQSQTVYSVDFDRIEANGDKCSDSNPVKDRLVVVPSEPAISKLTNVPVVKTLDLSTLLRNRYVILYAKEP